MRVVDTSAWLEWFEDGPLASRIGTELPQRPSLIVPTIVQLELSKWLTREVGASAAKRFISMTTECVVVDLTTAIALSAARLASLHRLSIADAIIYATALDHGADVLTCDAHFRELPDVLYLPKVRPDA